MSSNVTINTSAISHTDLDQNTSSTVSDSSSPPHNPGVAHRAQAALSNMDSKSGIGAKANHLDQRFGISDTANKVARQVGDVASHVSAAISSGHIGHAMSKLTAAAVIGEAEVQKHQLGADGAQAAIARDHPHGHEGNY